jgi:exosortase
MPQNKAIEDLDIRVVVLIGRLDFGRCPLATRLPTALWPVLGKTALERLLDSLAELGIRNVAVCCPEEVADRVRSVCSSVNLDVRVLVEDLASGTAGCVRDAVGTDPGSLIMAFSGSMMSVPSVHSLMESCRSDDAVMTMMFNPDQSRQGPPGRAAEIYFCKPSILSYIPPAGYSDIKEGLVPAILRAGRTIRPLVLDKDVGNFHDHDSYLDALLAYLAQSEDIPAGYSLLGVNGGCLAPSASGISVHPTARVYGPVAVAEKACILEDAVVVGPAVIGRQSVVGPSSVVVRSALWDGVWLGRRCEIRESVVDRSVAIRAGAAIVGRAVASHVEGPHGGAQAAELPRRKPDWLGVLWREKLKRPAFVLGIGVVFAAFLWSYWPTIVELWKFWRLNLDESAGLLVPFLAAYIVWLRRHSIGSEGARPAVLAGAAAFVLAQGIRSVGLWFMYGSGERLSIILSIGALVLLLGGWTVLKRSASILAFLCLMLPLPNRVQSQIGLPLQSWATTSAVFCLELAGYDVVRNGNTIDIGGTSVAVAEACNGLRMIAAFIIITALVVLLAQRSWWEKLVVLISSLPIALLCNTLRLTVTAVAYTLLKGDYWRKMFHDFGGYAMMPVALALVVGEFWILARLTTPPEQTQSVVIERRKPRIERYSNPDTGGLEP